MSKAYEHSHFRESFLEKDRMGNTIRGNKNEGLRDGNLPPRESPRAPPKTSERYTCSED